MERWTVTSGNYDIKMEFSRILLKILVCRKLNKTDVLIISICGTKSDAVSWVRGIVS